MSPKCHNLHCNSLTEQIKSNWLNMKSATFFLIFFKMLNSLCVLTLLNESNALTKMIRMAYLSLYLPGYLHTLCPCTHWAWPGGVFHKARQTYCLMEGAFHVFSVWSLAWTLSNTSVLCIVSKLPTPPFKGWSTFHLKHLRIKLVYEIVVFAWHMINDQ